jgi:signal transduction histidine kinase
VGRSIADELRNATAIAWLVPLAGVTVLLIGLIIAWWVINRSVRPIQQIEATADEIRRGKLSARVPISSPDNELGQLSSTLNTTFARLQTAFERQKQFTSDAAHELRTPLAIMISEAQTTLARLRTAEQYKEALEGCLEAAQEMRKLTDTLLDLARLDLHDAPIPSAEVDLADVAQTCIQRLQAIATIHSVALKSDPAPAIVLNVAERMSLVVTNLVLNAICYNRPGGEVLVRTWSDGDHSILTVADTGTGIASTDLPRIFDRFYRGDKARSREGGHAGLGLSICKTIVECDGGMIQVESEIGKGTLFTVRLPGARVAAQTEERMRIAPDHA